MLAHHPLTGEPIKIIRTNPTLHADLKTLVWVRGSFVAGNAWTRWFTVISEPSAYSKLQDGSLLTAVILSKEANIEEWLPLLPKIFYDGSATLLVAPARLLNLLDHRGFKHKTNVFHTEDIYESYPYLGSALTADDDVPTVVCALAHILRMNRIVWSDVTISGRVQTLHEAWKSHLNGFTDDISADSDDSIVPRTWLIQQYFHHTSTRRAREIFTCLEKNLESPYIDHVLLLNEKEYPELPTHEKITIMSLPHRMTYFDVYKTALDHVPLNDIIIFSNSDIHVDESLLNLWRIQLEERRMFLALLRWESDGKIFGPRADSQDTWIFSRRNLDWALDRSELDFPFGKPGCDNVITCVMMKHKFLVVNPAYTIKTHHLHASNVRNYDPKDIIYRPVFVYVEPTPIHAMSILTDMKKYTKTTALMKPELRARIGSSFPRVIEGVDDSNVATCISMLIHAGVQGYSHGGDNLYTPSILFPELYHTTDGAFATCTGLVYSFNQLWAGTKAWSTMWNTSLVETLTPAIYVPKLLVYPTEETLSRSLSSWILHYLPRVVFLRDILSKHGIQVEFLVPQTQYIGDFLNDCVWNGKSITVVPMMTDMNYYSNDLWVVPPDTTAKSPVTKEDIEILRQLAPSTPAENSVPTVTLCYTQDDTQVCTREWAESVGEYIFGNGWKVHYISDASSPIDVRKAFAVSNWIVGAGDVLDYMWYAKSARVMEFQRIDAPSDANIHLAGACGHKYILGGVIRGEPVATARQNALLALGRAVQKYGFKESLDITRAVKKAERPTIILPTGNALQGIFSHCGDTFREMVTIWGERDYVTVKTSDESGYVWWNGIGQILLYDRPTSRWWNPDIPYQMALFGNCAPPGPEAHLLKQSAWSFWPRSPRAIEKMAESCLNLHGWDSRPITSLFLGKVENGVQRAARTGADWEHSVDLWSMPFDSTGKAYPYTQEQYLMKLCSARFGLCLPGFGPKCNREIEYFACGCVPIITPGVDMKGYLVPPIEGIHYLVASTPDEVKSVIAKTTPESWARMSAAGRSWWRTHASAEGMFRLTWARIEQCRPYMSVGIPKQFAF